MSTNAELAREKMIEQQIRAWEVLDENVLDVMRSVRRELFVPPAYRDLAFADMAVPLGYGQSMLPPKIDGRILQALKLRPTDLVLDVGSGSGFLAACMGRLAGRVRSIEIVPQLAEFAAANVLKAAINNVAVETGDAMLLDENGVYDAIAVTASLPLYDDRFARALRIGGRLFVVVGTGPIMEALKITRTGEREWQRESLFETVIEPLANAPRPPQFKF
jgi:protein-L-isoaspartate(D-aspartate) O-methyltransferase